jgi:hypothetical protein
MSVLLRLSLLLLSVSSYCLESNRVAFTELSWAFHGLGSITDSDVYSELSEGDSYCVLGAAVSSCVAELASRKVLQYKDGHIAQPSIPQPPESIIRER